MIDGNDRDVALLCLYVFLTQRNCRECCCYSYSDKDRLLELYRSSLPPTSNKMRFPMV